MPENSQSATSSILLLSQLSPDLSTLAAEAVQELQPHEKLSDLIDMLKFCPVSRASISLKSLRAKSALGEYHHPDTQIYKTASGLLTIQEWIRSNFESMQGSLVNAVGKIFPQVDSFGCSASEIVWIKKNAFGLTEWRLKKIITLNPTRYTFAGMIGRCDRLIYTPLFGTPFAIPYNKVLHIYNPNLEEPEDPRGDANAFRALPFFQARKTLLKQWVNAGQRQASGMTVIKVPSEETVRVLDSKGRPIFNEDGTIKTQAATYAVAESAKDIESGSIFITDKKNDVISIPGNAGDNFFNTGLTALQKLICLCYGVPSTIFDDTASGIGNAGINAGHRLILDAQIESLVISLRDEILEKIVRPLLVANFGRSQENNLGEFKSEKFLDPAMSATRVSNLMMALANGVVDPNDLEAINRLREDLGISPLSKEGFDILQIAKQQAAVAAEE